MSKLKKALAYLDADVPEKRWLIWLLWVSATIQVLNAFLRWVQP